MSFYDTLTWDGLVDLLKAYDSYIATAAEAKLFDTGWTPVCVEEFYDNEYQNVWRQGGSFDYMYESEPELSSDENDLSEVIVLPGVRVFSESVFCETGQFLCQFGEPGENGVMRPLRSQIQDICEGDAFIAGSAIHYASADAHQNLDEPDNPWIVYDEQGGSWFEEDIVPDERGLSELMQAAYKKGPEKPSLDEVIGNAKSRTPGELDLHNTEKER